MGRTKIEHSSEKLRLADVKMKRRADKKHYVHMLSEQQLRMLRIQQAYYRQGLRAIMVFEGWDAGGKGGSIRRLTGKLDPRGYRVHPISAPTPDEQGRHYLYRFWTMLPKPGGLAVFDRSWYGRVLVERVEGFARTEAWKRAYDEINEFERMLVDDGVRIVKFFMHISPEEQLKRFQERLRNPYKRWKLTTDDFRNRSKWDAYAEAIEDMFDETSTTMAPWHVIPGDHKWYARTRVLEIATEALGKGVDLSMPIISPDVVKVAENEYGLSCKQLDEAEARAAGGKSQKKRKKKNGKGKAKPAKTSDQKKAGKVKKKSAKKADQKKAGKGAKKKAS